MNEEYKKFVTSRESVGDSLKRIIETWLLEDEIIERDRLRDEINPFQIAATIMKRVCQIAGHAWLEFHDHDGPIMASSVKARADINAYLAEFIPELEPDAVLESFATVEGGDIRWDDVTNEHLIKLFSHLLDASSIHVPVGNNRSNRPAAGKMQGVMNLVSPDKLREYSESWFADRAEAYITPAWQMKGQGRPLEIVRHTPAGSHYSFTPEYYVEGDNCVTWASRTLDRISPPNWLETVRIQCHIAADLVQERCEDYHIKDEGRVRCATLYAYAADKSRVAGLRSFA